MPRRLLSRYLKSPFCFRRHWLFQRFGKHLYHPGLWHLNRRSIACASGLGLFVAFLPIPFQMVLVTLAAFWLRANLPLSLAFIFVTNPLTMGPLFYLCYRLGSWITGTADVIKPGENFQADPGWLLSQLEKIWWPLWAGSVTTGLILGVTAYGLVQIAWIRYVIHKRGTLFRRLNQGRQEQGRIRPQ